MEMTTGLLSNLIFCDGGFKGEDSGIMGYATGSNYYLEYSFRKISLIDVWDGGDMGRWDGCEENPSSRSIQHTGQLRGNEGKEPLKTVRLRVN